MAGSGKPTRVLPYRRILRRSRSEVGVTVGPELCINREHATQVQRQRASNRTYRVGERTKSLSPT